MPRSTPDTATMAMLEPDLRSAKHRREELEFKLADMSWALKLARASITKHFSSAHLGLELGCSRPAGLGRRAKCTSRSRAEPV